MSGAPLAFTEWIMGAAVLSVAVTMVAFTLWWGAPDREMGPFAQLARLSVALTGHGLVLLGLVILTIGTENLLDTPLGRWSGSPMVIALWFVLEVVTRELVWAAAHAHRRFGGAVGAVAASVAAGCWLVAKTCLALCGIVLLAAFIES